MSMRDYAFHDFGVVLNDLMDDDLLQELAEEDIVEYQFSFTGEAFPLDDKGHEDWGHGDEFDDNTVYYISVHNYPTLFKRAYRNMDELVDEMLKSYRDARRHDKRMPALSRKKIRKNLRFIEGTYYG